MSQRPKIRGKYLPPAMQALEAGVTTWRYHDHWRDEVSIWQLVEGLERGVRWVRSATFKVGLSQEVFEAAVAPRSVAALGCA